MNKGVIMKERVINPDNLSDEDIDFVVIRVKAIIVNDNNEVLTSFSDGGIQIAGGHVEEGEELIDTLKREISEEVGIILDEKDIIGECFYKTIYYQKNFKECGKNRKSIIYCFYVKTNKAINENNFHHTENEIKNNLCSKFLSFKEFEEFANNVANNSENELNRGIAKEILNAWNEYKALEEAK